MMVDEEISLIVSSNTANGASNKSSDGSYFEVNLDEPISIPREALNVTLSEIWWVVPNIYTGVNDKLYITGPSTTDVLTNYVVTIPQGLYDLSALSQSILRELENQDAKISPYPLISLTPDDAQQKVQIRFNYNNVSIDMTPNDTFRNILGLNSAIYGPYATAPYELVAPNIAGFNTVNYFLIHSDLTSRGIRFNNTFTQVISQILIDVPPGSQITYAPFNFPSISLDASRKVMRFWLTNDKNERVNTNGENWSARVVIKYKRPFIIANTDYRLR